jgi:hypothetical protein
MKEICKMTALTFDKDEVFETDNWKQKMSGHGETLNKNNVRLILLAHGTFVGNDAFGLFDLIEPLDKSIADTLREEGKYIINKLAKDVGNYTPEYASAMENSLGNNIPCELFVWSSGNFHLARIKGTVELAQTLVDKIVENHLEASDRILLMGHSHAGQLFALLTTFLANDANARQLYEIMAKEDELNEGKNKLISNLEIIKTISLDIVTFGTPVRYTWGQYDKYRLKAMVNHRSNVEMSGLLKTRDGDYVQQWGVEGTDIFPPEELRLNDEFDRVLDTGRDSALLIASLEREERRHPKYADGTHVGESLFINYKDDSLILPNCIKTLFGHGVYTNYNAMLFNMATIVKEWYS